MENVELAKRGGELIGDRYITLDSVPYLGINSRNQTQLGLFIEAKGAAFVEGAALDGFDRSESTPEAVDHAWHTKKWGARRLPIFVSRLA